MDPPQRRCSGVLPEDRADVDIIDKFINSYDSHEKNIIYYMSEYNRKRNTEVTPLSQI